jgi:hypothetical protein
MNPDELVRAHVRRFNAGVETGDLGPMLDGLTEDAVMSFEGVPIAPSEGRTAIEDVYRRRPPDDTIEILTIDSGEEKAVAAYAWSREGGRRAGEMRFAFARDGRIDRLVVTFDQAS